METEVNKLPIIPGSARRAPRKWTIRYSTDWGCTFWCSSSSSLTVCRSASGRSWRKDLVVQSRQSVTEKAELQPGQSTTHRKVRRRPFSSNSWPRGWRQSICRRSGRSAARSRCRPTCFPAFPRRHAHGKKEMDTQTHTDRSVSFGNWSDSRVPSTTWQGEDRDCDFVRVRERERERVTKWMYKRIIMREASESRFTRRFL